MIEMPKFLRPVAVGVACVLSAWFVAYIVVWQLRSGCHWQFTLDCNRAFSTWLGDLIMLEWVRSYQTLIAGLLALGAGAFVVWAAYIAADTQRRTAQGERRDKSLAACTIVAARFIDAAVALRSDHIVAGDFDFAMVDTLLPDLARIDTMLAGVVRAGAREAASSIRRYGAIVSPFNQALGRPAPIDRALYQTENLEAAARAYAIAQILHQVEDRLDENGKFNFHRAGDLEPGVLVSHLEFLGVSNKSLSGLRSFFRWTASSQ